MKATENSNINNNVIVSSLEYILQSLYNFYYKVKVVFKDNWLSSGILISIITLSGLIYYLSLKNPNNIMDYIQTPSTILYVFLTTLLISLYFHFSVNSNQTEILKPVFKYLKLVGMILGVYVLISIFYFISKQIMFYGSKESAFGTIFIIICIMGILYNTLIKHTTAKSKSSGKYEIYDLLIDIIFYIPCLFINLIDYVKEDYNNTPSSTFILTGIVLCIILFFYALPYLINILKHDKGIKLLKEQTELNKSVVFVSQKDLREKIIQNRPLLERQMLHATNGIEKQYKTYGKYFDTQAQLFDTSSLYNNKKYLSSYGVFSPLADHPKCVNSSIKCDSSDNLLKCNGERLEDIYNIYQTCDNRQSFFNSLFVSPKEGIKIYPDSSKDKLLTLQEMCDIDVDLSNVNTSVNCISYNDISNQVINPNNSLLDQQIYACNDFSQSDYESEYQTFKSIKLNELNNSLQDVINKLNKMIDNRDTKNPIRKLLKRLENRLEKIKENIQNKTILQIKNDVQKNIRYITNNNIANNKKLNNVKSYLKDVIDDINNIEFQSDKYKVIYGYNDVDNISGPISCIIPRVYEGFEGSVHTLDNLLSDKRLFGEFSNAEMSIINRAITSEETNLKYVVDKFKEDPQKVKEYIIAFFASNDNFMTLMDYINKYNNETNIFLDQNLSNLIQQINLRSNIHEYNYHYGISFWVYFDSSILNMNSNSDKNHGLIMSYADQPRIYYDYNTNELKIDVLRHDSNKQQPNYKTKNILYQRWNHIVINYNYGVLDIFINNNLVGTINKLNPYVGKNNNIVFGSSTETLDNCGLCNVNYYEIPLKLSKIKEIYKTHENPCI